MQTKITSCLVGLIVFTLTEARPQTFNNFPYKPTFSDLDPYNSYTTPMTYNQNGGVRIWPYIVDQAVSPLYNVNGYGATGNGYNTNLNTGLGTNLNTGIGYNPNLNTGYSPSGFGTNTNSNGYYNTVIGYTTQSPYLINNNPFGIYNGKK